MIGAESEEFMFNNKPFVLQRAKHHGQWFFGNVYKNDNIYWIHTGNNHEYRIDNVKSITESTNLNDCDGDTIFFGDIVRVPNVPVPNNRTDTTDTGIVTWSHETSSTVIKTKQGNNGCYVTTLIPAIAKKTKIVGNVFDD